MTLIVQTPSALAQLGNVRAGIFSTPRMKLFQNNYVPSVLSILANFTEATFPGYASQLFVWGAPFINAGGLPEMDAGGPLTFVRVVGVGVQSIYGYFVIDNVSGLLLYAERFGSAIPIVNPLDHVAVIPKYTASSIYTG